MAERSTTSEGEITSEPYEWGTRVDLRIDGRSVSRLWVVTITLHIGQATVRMDGIAGVGTEEQYRRRGYSRRVMEATVERMRAGEAALAMLYGISDFYPKFGFATAGPEHSITLTNLSHETPFPPGWRARPLAAADLPAVHALYEQNTRASVGAAARTPEGRAWPKLAAVPDGQGPDACRVVETPAGKVAAYAWLCRGHWAVDNGQKHWPDALIIGEVMADGPDAADAVLATCRAWAGEEAGQRGQPIERVILSLPPEGPVAAAAILQSARFERRFSRCGGSMVRVLDVVRLLEALKPELLARLQAARFLFSGSLLFHTDLGDAALIISPEGIDVATAPGGRGQTLAVCLPQTALARLALGAFPPEDLLARLEQPPDPETFRLLEILFPLRHPHMYPQDRY